MQWAAPRYPRSQVDSAGKLLTNPPASPGDADYLEWLFSDRLDEIMDIVGNWRSSHSYPINTFQVTLRRNARKIDPNCIVAQRIKRLSSIQAKLSSFSTMQLSQMQDIGGCRAILDTCDNALKLVDVYKKSDIRHKLMRETNYIASPRSSGYRGVHLLYSYFSQHESRAVYNGLRLKIQIRSTLQHAWATAVETVGTFTRQALKSSLGESEWLRFFALMSTMIALRENCIGVPGTPDRRSDLVAELREYTTRLDVFNKLFAFGSALRTLEEPEAKSAHFFLLQLDAENRQVTISGFKSSESNAASAADLEAERKKSDGSENDAVLVSVDKVESLRRAYPNYFLDTGVFVGLLRDALSYTFG